MTGPLATRDQGAMQTKAERWWDGPWPWLIYLAFYAVPWLWRWPTTWQLTASAAGLAVFLPTYFISHRLTGARLFATAAVMLLVGVALAPVGGGWTVFPIYAASEAGRVGPPRRAAVAVALVVAVTIATGLAWHQPPFWWLTGVMIVVATGGATISRTAFYARTQALLASQEEVRRLAGTAERERITRDLHDVVGRTLTLAALRADLAVKLVGLDPARAKDEMRGVAEAARAGLAEVRAALAGQSGSSLPHEVSASQEALAAAGVAATLSGAQAVIPVDAGAVLAMTLREAVTNVIRHADASTCAIELAMEGALARLVVADDGTSCDFCEGLGLSGMRQRLTAAGGSLLIQPNAPGTRLVATVPA